jgi:hypothetical protein
MKSLDEAIDLFQITTTQPPTEEEHKQITDAIMVNHSRYRELISEAQNNSKVMSMAIAMVQMGVDMGFGAVGTVVIAISHAIAIGIEMEKINDEPVL